jgi:hypothetical protein
MRIYAEALNEINYPNTTAFTALNAVRTKRRLKLALELGRWFGIVRTSQRPAIFSLAMDTEDITRFRKRDCKILPTVRAGKMVGIKT